MGAGTSVIAGYLGGKLRRGRKQSKEKKSSKHRIRNAGRRAQTRTNKWRQKRADRSRFE